jgi:hypothetical protein
MACARSFRDSNAAGVPVLSRLDFILRVRLKGRPAIVGGAFAAALLISVLIFLLLGNGKVSRVLFFPVSHGSRLAAEQRLLPRHHSLEGDVRELVEGVLLGPMRHDLARVFPRGAAVRALVVHNGILYVDLAPSAALPDPEVPLAGSAAAEALARSARANFPGLREVVVFIDGQALPGPKQKKI